MATDYTILSQNTQPSIFEASERGIAASQSATNNRLQQAAMQSQTNMQDQKVQARSRSNQIASARLLHDTAAKLRQMPFEQRAAAAQIVMPQLQKLGVDVSQIDLEAHLDDATLDNTVSSLAPLITDPSQKFASKSAVGNETLAVRDGIAYSQSRILDPSSGQIRLVETALGPADGLTNKLGQTAEQNSANLIQLAAQKAAIDSQAKIATEQALIPVALDTAKGKMDIEVDGTGKKTAEAEAAQMRAKFKDQGIAAADNMSTLVRAAELNKQVLTGKASNWLGTVANFVGVADGEPGELKSLLAQNILGQLKSTFGASPTEGERAALRDAQASFDQSGTINQALLDNAIKLANARIARAKKAANTDNDTDTLEYIDEALKVQLGGEKPRKRENKGDIISERDRLRKELGL